MGYRSEVTIELKRDDYDKLCELFIKHTDVYPILNYANIYQRKMNDGEKVVALHWDWIKWYGDESISLIEEFLESVPYHKLIIGEDLEDAENLSSGDWPYEIDDVYVERRIVGWDIGEKLTVP